MRINCCSNANGKILFSFNSDHPPVVGDLITHNEKNYSISHRSWLVPTQKHEAVNMAVIVQEVEYDDK